MSDLGSSGHPAKPPTGGQSASHAVRPLPGPAITIVAATAAIELGTYALASWGQVPVRNATVAMLVVAAAWVALAAPALAAAGRGFPRTLLWGGLTADATLISLWAVWLLQRGSTDSSLTFLQTLELYCVYLAMAGAAASAVAIFRSAWSRATAAAIATIVMLALLAAPLWTGGLVYDSQGPTRQAVVTAVAWLDPLYSIAAAVVDEFHYVVHLEAKMYTLTLLGDYTSAPLCSWYTAAISYTALALLLSGVGLLRCRLSRQRG